MIREGGSRPLAAVEEEKVEVEVGERCGSNPLPPIFGVTRRAGSRDADELGTSRDEEAVETGRR